MSFTGVISDASGLHLCLSGAQMVAQSPNALSLSMVRPKLLPTSALRSQGSGVATADRAGGEGRMASLVAVVWAGPGACVFFTQEGVGDALSAVGGGRNGQGGGGGVRVLGAG